MKDNYTQYISDIMSYSLLSKEEEAELGARILKNDKEAIDELVAHNLRLVVTIANRYKYLNYPIMDMIQDGNMGLFYAACRFDYTQGKRFSTYAGFWIKQAIIDGLNSNFRAIRIPTNAYEKLKEILTLSEELEESTGSPPTTAEIAQALGTTPEKVAAVLDAYQYPVSMDEPFEENGDTALSDLLESTTCKDPQKIAIKISQYEIIMDILSTLSPKEQKIIEERFGFNDNCAEHTLSEISADMELTKERVRQLELRALKKLRAPMRKQKLEAVFYSD